MSARFNYGKSTHLTAVILPALPPLRGSAPPGLPSVSATLACQAHSHELAFHWRDAMSLRGGGAL